jgi:hypothetical protein
MPAALMWLIPQLAFIADPKIRRGRPRISARLLKTGSLERDGVAAQNIVHGVVGVVAVRAQVRPALREFVAS